MTPGLGAHPERKGTRFALWSTRAERAWVVLVGEDGEPRSEHALAARGGGEFEAVVPGVGPGARYLFKLDDQVLPDPYARFMPDGVHGPAEVIDPAFEWQYATRRTGLGGGWVLYELHVGAFTPQGTFLAAAERLPELVELGVTTIQLLPISTFPGRRGWGYDGVAHYAPFAGYGTPADLRTLVDRAHGLGLGVVLDVVYNHFGPDGNYLAAYSPEYFTSRHKTPWGDAPDFSEPHMRRYVLDNVRQWLELFRFDGLRLDATHTIEDDSATHILREIADTAHAIAGRPTVIAEDEHRGSRTITELGLDGFWADAFHHRVHILFTHEREGYYARYQGTVADLAAHIVRDVASHTKLVEGAPGATAVHTEVRAEQLVYCLQNHDQVGNRALGERFHQLAGLEAQRAAATLLLFLPQTPLLFMGEEWAASSPFLYFTDHAPELGVAVSKGRREEFKAFSTFSSGEARARIPDPQDAGTFERSTLDWAERTRAPHAAMLAHYRRLCELRKTDPVLAEHTRVSLDAGAVGEVLWVRRGGAGDERLCLTSFGGAPRPIAELVPPSQRRWRPVDLVTGREVRVLGPREAVVLAPEPPTGP